MAVAETHPDEGGSSMHALSPRRRRWHFVLIATLLLALFATACGGDDSDDGDGGGAQPTTTAGGTDDDRSTEDETPVAGGEATVLLFSEIGTLDPVKMTGSGGSDGQRALRAVRRRCVVDRPRDLRGRAAAGRVVRPPTRTSRCGRSSSSPASTCPTARPYDAAAVKANWDRDQGRRQPVAVAHRRCSPVSDDRRSPIR